MFAGQVTVHAAVTVVGSVSLLFVGLGSISARVTNAVLFRIVPLGTPGSTITTNVKTCGPSATVRPAFVAETVPLLPTGGVVVVQPAGAVNERNEVLAGTTSVKLILLALTGPMFCIVIVYVRLEPGLTGSGVSVFIIERSGAEVTEQQAYPTISS